MLKLSYVGVLILIVIIISCAYGSRRLHGGKRIIRGQFPFFGQLFIGQHREYISFLQGYRTHGSGCGCSLIHPRWVLTAGHCFAFNRTHLEFMLRSRSLFVYIDSAEKYNYVQSMHSTVSRYVVELRFHPKFHVEFSDRKEILQTKLKNDVAVAKLHVPFRIRPLYAQTVRLPRAEEGLNVCQKGIIIGGGKIKNTGQYNENSYSEVYTKRLEDLDVELRPSIIRDTVFYSQIRWGEGHPTFEDLGGPFVCYPRPSIPVQYGIMSSIHLYDKFERIDFESVAKHIKFIKRIVPNIKTFSIKQSVVLTVSNDSHESHFKRNAQTVSSTSRVVKHDILILLGILFACFELYLSPFCT
ncbi:hypothetical protein ILUMI_05656 [Ignelater luminosus]|uniref:Peptidase S1 domain-containing protein n=1 Tax=Ignelater luminosus TaxID=2038154 RepID=A0A8K0D6R0_IGNLU|nr:hypothetical protein ILUMI_05656 [Ignelater luminosus]